MITFLIWLSRVGSPYTPAKIERMRMDRKCAAIDGHLRELGH